MKLPTYSERHDTSLPTVTPQLRSAPAMEQAALRRVSGVMPTDYSGIAKAKAAKWGAITKAVTSIGEAYAEAAYKTDMQNSDAAAAEYKDAMSRDWWMSEVVEASPFDPATGEYTHRGLEERFQEASQATKDEILSRYQLRHRDALSRFSLNQQGVDSTVRSAVQKYQADKETEIGRDSVRVRLLRAVKPEDIPEIKTVAVGLGFFTPEAFDIEAFPHYERILSHEYDKKIEMAGTPEEINLLRESIHLDGRLSPQSRESHEATLRDRAIHLLFEDADYQWDGTDVGLEKLASTVGRYDTDDYKRWGFASASDMRKAKADIIGQLQVQLNRRVAAENRATVAAKKKETEDRLYSLGLISKNNTESDFTKTDQVRAYMIEQRALTDEELKEQRGWKFTTQPQREELLQQLEATLKQRLLEQQRITKERQEDQQNVALEKSLDAFGDDLTGKTFADLEGHLNAMRNATPEELGVETQKEKLLLINQTRMEIGRRMDLRNTALRESKTISKEADEKRKEEAYEKFLKQFNKEYPDTTYDSVNQFQKYMQDASLKELGLNTETEREEAMAWLLGRKQAQAARVEASIRRAEETALLTQQQERLNRGIVFKSDHPVLEDMFLVGVSGIDISTPAGFMEWAKKAKAHMRRYQNHIPRQMLSQISALTYGNLEQDGAIERVALAVEALRTLDPVKSPEGLADFLALVKGNEEQDALTIAAQWQKQQSGSSALWAKQGTASWDSLKDEHTEKFLEALKTSWGLDLAADDVVGTEVVTSILEQSFKKFYKGSDGAAIHQAVDHFQKNWGYSVGEDGQMTLAYRSPYAWYTDSPLPSSMSRWIDNEKREAIQEIARESGAEIHAHEIRMVFSHMDEETNEPRYYFVAPDGTYLTKTVGDREEVYLMSFTGDKPEIAQQEEFASSSRKGQVAWEGLRKLTASNINLFSKAHKLYTQLPDDTTPADSKAVRQARFAEAVRAWKALEGAYLEDPAVQENIESIRASMEVSFGHFIDFLLSKGFERSHGFNH